MRNVTLRLFETCHIHGITNVKGHEQRVNVAIDPPTNPYSGDIVTVPSYSHLKPGSSQIKVWLDNLWGRTVIQKGKSNIAQVTPMNVVPIMLVHEAESIVNNSVAKLPEALPKLIPEQIEKLFQKVEFSGTEAGLLRNKSKSKA